MFANRPHAWTVGRSLPVVVAALLASAGVARAGSLEPPGPPAPTMKTLLEIAPRTAVNTLPGSASAVHVIDRPGSYYLTADVVGPAGMNGIEITASHVVLDLNGFRLLGRSGSQNGVISDLHLVDIAVTNGVVRGWDVNGIFLQTYSGLISRIVAEQNGDWGMRLWSGSITDCAAHENNNGIMADNGVVTNCHATSNPGTGIGVVERGLVQGCTVAANGIGIAVFWHDVKVVDCVVGGNGAGVRLMDNSTVTRCQFVDNGFGLQVLDDGHGNRIEGNNFSGGDYGVVVDPAAYENLILTNTVSEPGTAAFQIPPGNSHGPIVTVSGVGDISSVAGADHPWANFVY